MKTNKFIQTTSRKNTSLTTNTSNSTYNKILSANKLDRKGLFTTPTTSGGLDRQLKYNNDSKSSSNDMTHYSSHSPNKAMSYLESLKDKIFSPGDFTSSKPTIKTAALMAELTNVIFSTPHSIQKPSIQPLPTKAIAPLIYLPEKTYNHMSRKTLFLDLDETLVHSAFKPFYVKADIVLNISFDQKNHTIYVLKRPHVDEFLDKMSKIFELVIFTASIPEYANPLLNKLDPNKRITSRLFREHCTASKNLFVKDLKKIGRHLKDTILLDNNPVSYAFNKENGLPILTWHSNKNDTELLKLIPLLEYLSKTDDVRDSIQKVVGNNYVNYFEVNRLINPNKEEEKAKAKANQTINSLNTLNNSMNNGASENYSMNLFSHHFSPFYFDTKDKKTVGDKDKDKGTTDKCGTIMSNLKDTSSINELSLSNIDKDNNKEKESEIDLFNNYFEAKKGTGNLFNDKKYKDKYDQFYDIKDNNTTSNGIFRNNSINKGIVLPSNKYPRKEMISSKPIGNIYHNESSSNIKKISESTSNQSLLCKSSIDQDVSRATSSRSNNFYSVHNNNDLGLDLNAKHNTSFSKSSDKKSLGEFKRNRFDYENKRMNNFIKKATISLLDPSPNTKRTFNQLSNWDSNVNNYRSNLVANRNEKNTHYNDTKANLTLNLNKNRFNSQTLRDRFNVNSYW